MKEIIIFTIIYLFFTNVSFANSNKLSNELIEQRADIYKQSTIEQKVHFLKLSKKNNKQKKIEDNIENVAKDLQSILAAKILDTMYQNVNPNSITGGGSAEKTYQSLLNSHRAKYIDLGLVEPIKNQIKKMSR